MPKPSKAKQWAIYGGVGVALCSEVSGAALAGYFLGHLLEGKIGGAPWWSVGLLLLFLSVALWHLTLVLNKLSNKEED